jgi:DNA polymerase
MERQLEIIQPEYICCLGAVAATTLLETSQSIGRMRGRFYVWRDAKVLVTYHPAYLLRNPSAKRDVWNDMQMLMADMGIEIPTRSRS